LREQAAPKMCQPVFLLESYFLSMLQSGENDYGILQSGYYRSADSRCCHRRGPWCLGRCEPHGRVRKRQPRRKVAGHEAVHG